MTDHDEHPAGEAEDGEPDEGVSLEKHPVDSDRPEVAEEPDEQEEPPRDEPAESPERPKAGFPWPMVAAVVAVVAIAAGAYLLGQRNTSNSTNDTTQPGGTATTVEGGLSGGVETFEDPDSGISFSYPVEWELLDTEDEDPTVVAVLSAGGQDSVLVRTVELDEPVTAENIADMNAVTDSIIAGSEVTVLLEEPIELNGQPGYYYFYRFIDAVTGEEGVHAHYFLFEGQVMNIIVLQAVPTARFDLLAPAFDAFAASFRSVPAAEAPVTTTTTSAPEPGG